MGDMEKLQTAEDLSTHATNREQPARLEFLDALLILARNVRFIAGFTVAGLVVGAVIAFLLRPTFTASAIILPPQQQQSSIASLMGQLGSLAALGGGGSLLKSPADLYVGILGSRTISDQVIEKFHLKSVYNVKKSEDARAALKKHIVFETGKDGLIHITVTDHDPNRASEIANAYVDGLHQLNSTLAITEAAQRRVFFDEQLVEERNRLMLAEEDLKRTQEKTGLIQLSGQAEAIIRSIADARAEIANREVQLQSLRTFATDQNPDVTRLQEEIDAQRQQLAKLEHDQQRFAPGDIEMPAGRVPEVGLEYARKLREVRFHEALFELLSKQFEAAKIDEAKSAPIIQVVDRAVVPDKKSGPHRLLVAVGFSFVAFCVACFWTFLKQSLRKLDQFPGSASKLRQLRDALHVKS